MRLAALLSVLAFLSACGPDLPAAPEGRSEPALTDTHFYTRDGLALPVERWPARHKTKAVILALHGVTDHAGFIRKSAAFWAPRGITTIAYDQRGHGGAPRRGVWQGHEAMAQDARDALMAVRSAYPDTPVFLLGESMGAAVGMLAAASMEDGPDALILVSPAVWGWSQLPALYGVSLRMAASVAPGRRLTGEAAGREPVDNPVFLIYHSMDPKVGPALTLRGIYGLVTLMEAGLAAASEIAVPTFVIAGTQDEVVPPETFDVLRERLTCETVRLVPSGHHMLLRDRAGLFYARDILNWLQAFIHPRLDTPRADMQGACAHALALKHAKRLKTQTPPPPAKP